mmetsp:Transcript_37110/g.115272  ORF Transcript_37110/g.115272 Transcript_37110/m.115272 type:complete len:211 (-) Transcript_37110:90-722(-)
MAEPTPDPEAPATGPAQTLEPKTAVAENATPELPHPEGEVMKTTRAMKERGARKAARTTRVAKPMKVMKERAMKAVKAMKAKKSRRIPWTREALARQKAENARAASLGEKPVMKQRNPRPTTTARGWGAKCKVFKGEKARLPTGLRARDLMKNKYGRVVFKKKAALAAAHPWIKAVREARVALGTKGWVTLNSGPEGKALYAKAKAIYGK